MVTITLTPELEQIASERAKQQGTTPELWTLDQLNQLLEIATIVETTSESSLEGQTMADFFKGYVGVISSSEFVPGGAQMSQDTGRKFTEGMIKKRHEGKL